MSHFEKENAFRNQVEAAWRGADVTHPGLGAGIASGSLASSPYAPPARGLIAAAYERLNILGNLLDVAESNAAATRSRMFGDWPEATDRGNEASKPYTESGVLLAQIDTLIQAARRIGEHTAALGAGL